MANRKPGGADSKPQFVQQSLFEEMIALLEGLAPTLEQVALADLPGVGELRCDPPAPELKESVRLWKRVWQPIGLVARTDGGYDLAWGRRRTWAAILAGLDTVPALVFPAGTPTWALTLTENNARSENPQSDLWALDQAQGGFSAEEAALLGGLNTGTLKRRMKILTGLNAELVAAWQAGKIKDTVAEAASSLKPEQQDELLRVLTAAGKVTHNDVHKVKRLAAVGAMQHLAPAVLTPLDQALHAATGSTAPVVPGPGDAAVVDSRGSAMGLLLAARECFLPQDRLAQIALDRVITFCQTGEWDAAFVFGVLPNMKRDLH